MRANPMSYRRTICCLHTHLLPAIAVIPIACGSPAAGDDGGSGTDNGADTDSGADTDGSTTTPPSADSGDSGDTTAATEPDDWDDLLEPVPGSRLRPVIRVAEDGTRAQSGWHDTLLDTPCDFRPTPSSGLRCVPNTASQGGTYYADPSCSEPVFQDHWFPEGANIVRVRGNSCFDETYYEIGEPVTEIYFTGNGSCQFFSNTPSHRVVAIPHEQFVEATVTPQEGNSRIVPMLLEADDGARRIFGAWDVVHQEEVIPDADTSDQLRWLGRFQPRVSSNYYADASCTQRVAVAQCVHDSYQPTTARENDADACNALIGRHALLEEVNQVYRVNDSGNCISANPSGYNLRKWRVGGPLDDTAFAETPATNDGGARLRHEIYANPEGTPLLASSRFYDLQLSQAECDWRDLSLYDPQLPLGTFDCVPREAARLDARYLDSECTERTASISFSDESCPPDPALAYGDGLVVEVTTPLFEAGSYGPDGRDRCGPLPPRHGSDTGLTEIAYYATDSRSGIEAAHAVDVVE